MPIWYVIMIQTREHPMVPIWRIVKSIPTTLEDMNEVYEREVAPLLGQQSAHIQWMFFTRDVENPINSWKEEGN